VKSAFSFQEGKWNISWPGKISQHDIVCLSPPLDPVQGLPLGNGDIGALVWCEPQRLVIIVNKCDLWDDSPDTEAGGFNENSPYWEDRWTALRHACRLEIDLGMPFMDTWYLKDFEARLDLARAMVLIRSVTPFGSFKAKVFVSEKDNVLAVDYAIQANEPVASRVTVERWGSRTFAHWYSQIQKDPCFGLSGTHISTDGNVLILTQQLNNMHFAVVASAQSQQTDISPRKIHSRKGVFELPATKSHSAQVLLTVANSEEVLSPSKEGKQILAAAREKGISLIEKNHCYAWREFWNNLFVCIDDKFIENLWYLTIYYAGSSQRGRYPALFTQGLWGWNRDFQPWCHYYHWNQQQLPWPLPPANHPELMKPYLNYRFGMLEKAKEAAARLGKKGAYYADIADRNGHQFIDYNRTPGGQIAADFWRYFRYTGDVEFLREKAWPVISEVAKWHYSLLEKKEDGLYHATPGRGYEGENMLKDCTSELATTRRVFEIAIQAARILGYNPPELVLWKESLTHLVPTITMESPQNPGVEIFAAGLQKGREKNKGKHFGSGYLPGDDEEWQNPQPTCKHDPRAWGTIFTDVETSMVFPSGNIGLKDKGTREFELVKATARECVKGWTYKIVLARLGMRAELKKELESFEQVLTCTGFALDICGLWDVKQVADAMQAPENYICKDINGPEWDAFKQSRIPMRMWEFRRIGQESIYLIATVVNESLLQSYDGVIRVAPAVAPGSPFAFTLLAEGGFLVSSQGVGEQIDWIHIYSRRGGLCRVVNPWEGKKVFCRTIGSNAEGEFHGPEISFATEPGEMYLLFADECTLASYTVCEENLEPNRGPRHSSNGRMVLGIPRMF